MRALYRTRFQLRDAGDPQAQFDQVAAACFQWVVTQQSVKNPPSVPSVAGDFKLADIADRHELEACRIDRDGKSIWGLRFIHEDHQEKGQWWFTELGLFRDGDGANHFSCSVLLGRRDGQVHPVQQLPGRPRIVRDILRDFGGGGKFPLLTQAVEVQGTEESVEQFLQLLEYPERTHPIVFVSRSNGSEDCIVSPIDLADKVCGIAHLIVAQNSYVSRLLDGLVGKKHGTYDGAIRIYWPQFQRSHQAHRHPLYVPDKIRTQEGYRKGLFRDRLLARLADVAAFNTTEPFITWPRLQELRRRRAMDEAKDRGELSQLVVLQDEQIGELETDLKDSKMRLEDAELEVLELQEIVQNYQRAIRGSNIEIQEDEEELPPITVADAIARAKKRYAKQLAFAWNSKSEEKNSPYHKPEEVYAAFEWLATVYYEAKIGKTACHNFSDSIKQAIPGWNYSAKQSGISLGRNKEWYEASWKKQTYVIEEHLKKGIGTDPSHCIRIAFAWDEEKRRIILGFLGQHQRNTKS